MDIYVIPPATAPELMHLGDRYFCLAQEYLKSEKYREFFKEQVRRGNWVTLDNGAGDHNSISKEELLDIARELQPSELIPLDILFDSEATLKNLDWTVSQMKVDPLLQNIEIFACPQGYTFDTWMEAYTLMMSSPEVNTIGLSKIAVPWIVSQSKYDENIGRDRNYMYRYLKERHLIKKPLHFLGAGEPWEFKLYKNDPMCRSTDSCFTIWSALQGQILSDPNFVRIPTPKNYFELEVKQTDFPLIKQNVNFLKSIISV